MAKKKSVPVFIINIYPSAPVPSHKSDPVEQKRTKQNKRRKK